MKKQYQLRDSNNNLLDKSSNRKKIEGKAANADCETKVIMVMVKQ